MHPGHREGDSNPCCRWGQEEAGIDGGGLFKEFLTSLSKEAFDTDRGLWLATSQNELYPNPHSYAKEGRSSQVLLRLSRSDLQFLTAHQLHWYTFVSLGKGNVSIPAQS